MYIKKSLARNERILSTFKVHLFIMPTIVLYPAFWIAYMLLYMLLITVILSMTIINDKFTVMPFFSQEATKIFWRFTELFGFLAILYFFYRSFEYGITNRRIIEKHGIITRKTCELRLEAVESVSINQGIFGRIFGFGTIIVTGRGTVKVKMKVVKTPLKVKKVIEEICTRYQKSTTRRTK